MVRPCLVFGVLAVASVAQADHRPLGEGLDIVVENGSLEVRKGTQRYQLAAARALTSIKIDARQRRVDLAVQDDTCAGTHALHFGFDQLAARLENAAAFRRHVARDWTAAAAGFARAQALDPGWNLPAGNLASAKLKLGDPAGALQALAPWLTAAPIATYVQVTSDPELVALLEQPPLMALRATRSGTAKLTVTGIEGDIAVSPGRALLAVARTEAGWGAGHHFERRLELYDTRTGAMVATTPIILWAETDTGGFDGVSAAQLARRPVIAARVQALQAMLDQLGFVRASTAAATVTDSSTDEDEKQLASFDQAKLGLVIRHHIARVLRKNDVLASATVPDRLTSAQLVADANVVVVFTRRLGREGCEGTDPTLISVLPIVARTP
jgi:hypothetical protein